MVDNIVSKPLRLVLIFTAHMVFNDTSQAEVTRILGTNITLEFKFNTSVTKVISVYKNHNKIAGYSGGKISSNEGNFDIYLKNTSVFFCIANLTLNHSGIYSASLFMDLEPAKESNNQEQLIVREENKSSTVLSKQNDITTSKDSGSLSYIVTVLVVSPVVLLAAALPLLIWCLVRTNDKQPPSQQSSNPTVQETVEASYNVPEPPLIYSVLDFPKRPSAVLEIHPIDTEYAAVHYLPEKRQV
ncbi:uncharacterized protein LOC117950997 [Etheostoma cragini]|uniref:uncharacterized protein LOC117950997 n=1 Tax=Etheostoma cragini TaxID=417921 RepID=UPI00155E62B1|nr:uncharacterized protein LOC117950997 [Etheostoma cragini]